MISRRGFLKQLTTAAAVIAAAPAVIEIVRLVPLEKAEPLLGTEAFEAYTALDSLTMTQILKELYGNDILYQENCENSFLKLFAKKNVDYDGGYFLTIPFKVS